MGPTAAEACCGAWVRHHACSMWGRERAGSRPRHMRKQSNRPSMTRKATLHYKQQAQKHSADGWRQEGQRLTHHWLHAEVSWLAGWLVCCKLHADDWHAVWFAVLLWQVDAPAPACTAACQQVLPQKIHARRVTPFYACSFSCPQKQNCDARCGARTHDHKVKSLALYRLS